MTKARLIVILTLGAVSVFCSTISILLFYQLILAVNIICIILGLMGMLFGLWCEDKNNKGPGLMALLGFLSGITTTMFVVLILLEAS